MTDKEKGICELVFHPQMPDFVADKSDLTSGLTPCAGFEPATS